MHVMSSALSLLRHPAGLAEATPPYLRLIDPGTWDLDMYRYLQSTVQAVPYENIYRLQNIV
jgi:hypothetical protein